MAHSKYRVFEEERNTLYLAMDGDNRLTGDPKEIDRILERKQKTDIRIYRMLTGVADSDEFSESEEDAVDDRPKVKLIVEEVLPDGAEDDKPADPVGDFVDPLSQLDTEQMLRLKTALASEQAKQILGDNVTAMLDVLSVDDTAFLRNSIMQDHCYTSLTPNEDPNGPSFVQYINQPELHKRSVGRPVKNTEKLKPSTAVRSENASPPMPDSDDEAQDDNDKEYADTPEDSETDGEDGSDSDYRDRNSVGFGVRTRKRGGARTRGSSFRGRHKRNSGRFPRREREEPPKEVKPQQAPVVTKIIKNYTIMKRGRARRVGLSTAHRPAPTIKGPSVPSSSTPEPELPVDHVAAKMYSNDAIRLGRSGKTEEERRKEIVRVLQNLPFTQKVSRTILTGNRPQVVQAKQIVTPAASTSKVEEVKPKPEEVKKPSEPPVKNVMGGKYPRRENRKLPSHLADSIGPEIFSMPDVIRRKQPQPTGEVKKAKPSTTKILQNPVNKYVNKAKVDSSPKEQSTDDLTANLAATVNDLQCMLEEGLNEPKAADETEAAAVVSSDASLKEAVNQVTDPKMNSMDETQSLDISQMDESLLQGLPVANIDELLQTVAAQEANAEIKENTLYTSAEGVCSDSGENNSQTGEGSSAVERRRSVPKRRRSDEVSSLEDSDIDDVLSEVSWNSDDDPDKLWCICRQPHNNRFMICCDVCEEWFHGKCVGIPKSIGKQMERDNLEWSCPACRDKKSGDDKTSVTKPKLQQTKLVTIPRKRQSSGENPIRKCIMCKAPARENSIYCSDQCISKHSQKALSQLTESSKSAGKSNEESVAPRRIIVLDPTNKQMLTGQSAPTVANLATWLLKNPSYRVFNPKDAQLHSPNEFRNVRKVVQMKPNSLDSKKQMTLTVSPNSKIVKVVHGNNPVLKVISPGTGLKNQVVSLVKSESDFYTKPRSEQLKIDRKLVDVTKTPVRRRKEKEQPAATSSKTDPARERGNERAVRDSVRRTLGDTLKSRVDECDDLQVEYAEIEDLATQIEERLYKHFENKVDAKYKSKFRSLVFNIKDQKNTTLFRKIVEKAISPKELVRLSPDEMASQELAQWREKENQHQLEIIKKSELELMTQGQTFIIKSRKGEEVIEKVQNVAAEIDPNTSAQELVSALNSVSSTTPDNAVVEKTKKSETSLMKMKKREKEKRREREKRRKRSRSRSRSRTSKRSSRKHSRSRSRDRHRRSSDKKESDSRSARHSRDSEKVREKKEEEKEQEREIAEPVKEEAVEITTSEDVEQKIQDPAAEETDFEPTSTVTIKTPDPQVDEIEEPEVNPVWNGQIAMAEVAKFLGYALPAAGECESISGDFGEKLNVIGRIGYSNVWDYLVKMKLSASKEILILQILPKDTDQDRLAFSNLHSYLEKRSRIAVIKPANDRIKDFYLYPHKEGSEIPEHLQPITIPLKFEKGCMLFGIVVRTKKGTRSAATTQKYASNSPLFKVPLPPPSPEPTSKSKISQLPLPEPPPSQKTKLDSKVKRKIRVQVQPVPKTDDDGDSPYSPASSDEDLPPIQIPKKVPDKEIPPIETDEIQKKIDEMNRAIEEQTQQIQSLASTVPLLPVLAASLPVGAAPDVATLNSSLKALTSILTTPMEPEIVELDKPVPMEIDDPQPATSEPMSEEPYSPSGSLSPAPEEPIVPAPLVLPQEVAKISIPSNLHEILASIKQTAPDPPDAAPSPPSSPKSSPRVDDSPEPLPPGVDMVNSPPEPPKIVVVEEEDEAPPVKITPKKPIKFDIKINQKTKAMLAEAANDALLSRTDRDERFVPAETVPTEKVDKTDKPEKPSIDTESKPARVAHRTPSNKDDRRSRHFGRRSDAHKSDRHRDHDRKELEAEWEGSIRKFENESRRRHREIREKEIERLRKRSDSD